MATAFHAVKVALAATRKCLQVPTVSDLRRNCADELEKNGAIYAALIVGHTLSVSVSNGDTLHPGSLVQSCLLNAALTAYHSWVYNDKLELKDNMINALKLALEREAKETKSSGHWSSLPQIYAVATCTGTTIKLVYPDANKKVRQFLHTVVPSLADSLTGIANVQADLHIAIMWSSTVKSERASFLNINHFVPLVLEHLVTKGCEGKHVSKQSSIKAFVSKGMLTAKNMPHESPQAKQMAVAKPSIKQVLQLEESNQEKPTTKLKKIRPTHHRTSGFDENWQRDFPWVPTTYSPASTVPLGILCSLCIKHGRRPQKVF